MPDFPHRGEAAHLAHNVMRRPFGWFIDYDDAVHESP
jgi:hypothetical protein